MVKKKEQFALGLLVSALIVILNLLETSIVLILLFSYSFLLQLSDEQKGKFQEFYAAAKDDLIGMTIFLSFTMLLLRLLPKTIILIIFFILIIFLFLSDETKYKYFGFCASKNKEVACLIIFTAAMYLIMSLLPTLLSGILIFSYGALCLFKDTKESELFIQFYSAAKKELQYILKFMSVLILSHYILPTLIFGILFSISIFVMLQLELGQEREKVFKQKIIE